MSSTVYKIPPEVLAVLGLPAFDGLNEEQVNGRVCVWGTEQLTIETAVDLGEQKDGSDGTWFPRACRRCVADRANRGLFTHGSLCEPCQTEETARDCAVGRGLYRAVRDCRR